MTVQPPTSSSFLPFSSLISPSIFKLHIFLIYVTTMTQTIIAKVKWPNVNVDQVSKKADWKSQGLDKSFSSLCPRRSLCFCPRSSQYLGKGLNQSSICIWLLQMEFRFATLNLVSVLDSMRWTNNSSLHHKSSFDHQHRNSSILSQDFHKYWSSTFLVALSLWLSSLQAG